MTNVSRSHTKWLTAQIDKPYQVLFLQLCCDSCFFFMGNKSNPVDFFNLTAQLVERLGLTGWCYLRYQKRTLFKG